MKRNLRFFYTVLATASFFLMVILSPASATGKRSAKSEQLVLKEVTLFNNGVGFFQLRGQVPAGDEIRLRVKKSQMNDLLKSLTVLNLTSGRVSSIVYDNDKTIDQKLSDFNFQLKNSLGLPQILRQLQGSEIRVSMGNSAIQGTVMGVEKRNVREDKTVMPWFFLTIMDQSGEMRTFGTAEITAITFLDEKLNEDLDRYLRILFQEHQRNGKTVVITPQGDGPQEMMISFVTEVPVWKASYRIVIPEVQKEKNPFLQGWAIVDNVSGEDWEDVQLALVSGMPVSFIQELYAPRFKKRPELEMDDEAAVAPVVPEAAMAKNRMLMAAPESPKPRPGVLKNEAMAKGFAAEPDMEESVRRLKARTVTREVGDMFEYMIDHPVTIAQNCSALVPIVSKEIEGQAVDLYNEKARPEHPLAGIRLTNTTGLTLEGGPLTVLRGGTYAGEAYVKSLKPNEQRYITYAVDLGLHVNTKRGSTTEPVDRVVINRGVMRFHRGIIETRRYNLNNKNAQNRTVVIEHPYHSSWKLLTPQKPLETTDNYLRFQVTVPKNSETVFVVKELRDVWESISVSNLTPDNILIFARKKYLDEKTLRQLERIVAVKDDVARIKTKLKAIGKERDQIYQDQKRLRQNLMGLGQTSEEKGLRSRYIQQFASQEDRLGKMKREEETLKAQEQKQQTVLNRLINDLSMDLNI